jgi:gamma-glutamyl-gamma-aminobutyrate hydrolase PuuD
VEIEPGSMLEEIVTSGAEAHSANGIHAPRLKPGASTVSSVIVTIPVNSSHHQSADVIGDGLRIVARCPDGIIEAVEGTSTDHFVLAVQWHPERSMESDKNSRAILQALVEAARARHKELAGEFEAV